MGKGSETGNQESHLKCELAKIAKIEAKATRSAKHAALALRQGANAKTARRSARIMMNRRKRPVVIKAFSRQVFNSLIQIEGSKDLDLEKQAHELGQVLIKHKMAGVLNVSRIHNHYPCESKEQVVGKFSKDGLSFNLKPEPESSRNIPYMWSFNADNELYPTQFLAPEPDSCFNANADKVLGNQAFLQEFAAVIASQNSWGLLGFQLKYEAALPRPPNTELVEANWWRKQRLDFRPLKKTLNYTVTSWAFSQPDFDPRNPGAPSMCSDGGYCVGRCYCEPETQSHFHLSGGHDSYHSAD